MTTRETPGGSRADVWGDVYRAQWSGQAAQHELERDDGRIDVFSSAASYFDAPRSDGESDLLDCLDGPVLDLAAGPGSYALYLQDRGLDVTAAEYSPGAMEVCRARGCRSVASIDLRALSVGAATFRSIIVMGNTLGAHQTPDTLPTLLRTLRQALLPGGRLLFTMIDPLDTADEGHLRYQRRNRDLGLPPGLIRMRIRYRSMVDEWMHLWMLTDDELRAAAAGTGWVPREERRSGFWRVRLFETGVS